MSSVLSLSSALSNGDRMDQAEFHRRYQACPEGVKFELIGGTVIHGLSAPTNARTAAHSARHDSRTLRK